MAPGALTTSNVPKILGYTKGLPLSAPRLYLPVSIGANPESPSFNSIFPGSGLP